MKVISRSYTLQLGGHLVGTDVLGDAAGFLVHHVGVPDGVQQPGLSVVDVTHDGDHRRSDDQVALATLVAPVGQVERLEQLAVLVLRRDDLDLVAHLGAEQLQQFVGHRLGRGHHLAEGEHRLHHRGRVRVDLVGEVRQRGAAGQPHDLAATAGQDGPADRRRLHVVEFLATLLLGLAALASGGAALAAERTRGLAAAAAAATGTAATAAAGGSATGTAVAAAAGTAAAGTLGPVVAAATLTAAAAGSTGTSAAGRTGTRSTAGSTGTGATGHAGTRTALAGHPAGPCRRARSAGDPAAGTRWGGAVGADVVRVVARPRRARSTGDSTGGAGRTRRIRPLRRCRCRCGRRGGRRSGPRSSRGLAGGR